MNLCNHSNLFIYNINLFLFVHLKKEKNTFIYRAVVSGGAGGTLAPPESGSSVNPIPTRGGRLCPPNYC